MSKGRSIDVAHRMPVIGIYIVLALSALIILSFINPSFFGISSITNLVGVALPLVFVSMAQTMVVLVKGIDLSVGASVGLTTVFCASLMSSDGHNLVAVIIGALLMGILIGIINGGLVVLGRLQPIIVTLAMSSILTGVSLFIMPQPGGTVPGCLNWLVTGDIDGLPVPFIVMMVVSGTIWWPLRHSQIGQGLYAIGGNELGAYYSGVKVKIWLPG